MEVYLSQPCPPLNPSAPYRGADLPPGPRMPRLIQSGYTGLGFWTRRAAFLEQCRARYGTPFTLWMRLPPVPMVWVDDPEHAKAIYQAPADVLHAGTGSYELEHFFGRTGLAYMEGDEHLDRRKTVNRSTHGEELKRINEAMREITVREVAAWPRDEPFEIWPYAHRLALKAIFNACFAEDPDERLVELLDVVEAMMDFNNDFLVLLSTQEWHGSVIRTMNLYPPFRRFLKLRARADELIYGVIADRRADGGAGGMLGILVAEPIPAVEIRDELMTTFLAGSATTAAGITWGIELLGRQHAVREQLRSEIAADDGESYLEAVVNEILRHKPPLSTGIPRVAMKAFEMDGRVYAPGTRFVVGTYLLHHNPAVYSDPYTFRPERFLERPPTPYTFTAFGGGRRRCLGKAVGENEIKYVLREVLTQCEILPERPALPAADGYSASLKPRDSRVALTPRTRRS